MKFHIVTLFPEMVRQGLETSIIGRAVEKGLIRLNPVNIRDFTLEKHGRVDDYPYGGGAGMLMQAQPVFDAWKSVCGNGDEAVGENIAREDISRKDITMGKEAVAGENAAGMGKDTADCGTSDFLEGRTRRPRTIYVTPQGEPFTQRKARELAEEEELVILCGHYEGIDERVLEEVVTDYISIGDYVLTGGELAAMVIVDAVGRLVPGVLGNEVSAEAESFHGDLLEYPQYSRPETWHGKKVPEVLLSGDHRKVERWRLERAEERTAAVRPDLYKKYQEKQALIQSMARDKRNQIHIMESLAAGRGEILYRRDGGILVCDWEARVCMLSHEPGGGKAGVRPEVLSSEEPGGGKTGVRPEVLLSAVPEEAEWMAVPEGRLAEKLLERGFRPCGKFSQYLYTPRQTLPVRYRDIRRLTVGDLDYVSSGKGCCRETEKYLQERIRAGAMYGAFAEGRQIGFVGIHRGGGMGLLYVEEEYRRQGIGEALLSYNINRILEQGRTPYLHLRRDGFEPEIYQEESSGLEKMTEPGEGREAELNPERTLEREGIRIMEHLLEKLGLYRAGRELYWLRRGKQVFS